MSQDTLTNIQFAISGGVYPVSAEKGSLFGSFIVHYSDGTEAVYQTSGALTNKQAIDTPGLLTYIRYEHNGMWNYYWYTYTEEGITTDEFFLIRMNDQ